MMLADIRPKLQSIKCPSGHTIAQLCVNPKCDHNALRCGDKECIDCGGKKHITCKNVTIEEVTFLLRSRAKKSKTILKCLVELQI